LTRLAFTLAGIASTAAVVVAAAVIWLCLTEPAAVVDVVGSGQASSVFKVVAALVVSALGHIVRYL
jgi:hypothetical protein